MSAALLELDRLGAAFARRLQAIARPASPWPRVVQWS